MILQFMLLLLAHWFADFVCQTPWQAANKSSRADALLRHVMVYTAILAVPSIAMFGADAGPFVAVNGLLHLITDAFTSRWSKRHFGKAMESMAMGSPTAGGHFHNFFVVVGLDQLIHQACLAGTLWLMLAPR